MFTTSAELQTEPINHYKTVATTTSKSHVHALHDNERKILKAKDYGTLLDQTTTLVKEKTGNQHQRSTRKLQHSLSLSAHCNSNIQDENITRVMEQEDCFVDWEKERRTIADFINEYRDTLPRIVQVEEGFCGINEQCSLDKRQILVFHEALKQRRFIATDVLGRKVSIPSNCQHKVQLIPEDCDCEYYTVGDLKTACPRYFQVLESIPGTTLKAGSLIKTAKEQDSSDCFLNCQNVSLNDSNYGRNEQIPLMLKGRFLPLQDCGEYHLTEVTSMVSEISSLKIRFVGQSDCLTSDKTSTERLDDLDALGVLQIEQEYKEEMIFASTLDRRHMLIFPKALDILITPSKEDSFNESSPYAKSLQTRTSTKRPDLRRFKLLNQENAFFIEMPLMAFDYQKFIRRPTLKPVRPKAVQRSKPKPTPSEELPPPIPPKSPKKKLSPTPFITPKKTWLTKSRSADDAENRARQLELMGPPPLPPRKKELRHSDSDYEIGNQNSDFLSEKIRGSTPGNVEPCSTNDYENTQQLQKESGDADGQDNATNRSNDVALPTLPPRKKCDPKRVTPTPQPRKIQEEAYRVKPLPAPRAKPAALQNETNTSGRSISLPANDFHLNRILEQHKLPVDDDVCLNSTHGERIISSVEVPPLEIPGNHQAQIYSKHNIDCGQIIIPPPLPPKIKTRERSNSSPCVAFKWNITVDIPLDTDENNHKNKFQDDSPPYRKGDEPEEIFLLQLGKRPQTIGGSEVTTCIRS